MYPDYPHNMRQADAIKERSAAENICWFRGYHNDEEFIDPRSGGFVRCLDCGRDKDCEDPDGDCDG